MEKRRHKYVRGGKATLAIKFETEANLQDFAEKAIEAGIFPPAVEVWEADSADGIGSTRKGVWIACSGELRQGRRLWPPEGEVPDAIRLRILREAREAGVT